MRKTKTKTKKAAPRRKAVRRTDASGRGEAVPMRLFPALARRSRNFGLGAFWAVVQAEGGEAALRSGRIHQFDAKPGQSPRERLAQEHDLPRVAKALAALGHPQRLALVLAMLTGAGSHRELRTRTGLKAGPMYHHLRELRLGGLLEDGPRDVYRLSDLAVNLFWVCLAVVSGAKDVSR